LRFLRFSGSEGLTFVAEKGWIVRTKNWEKPIYRLVIKNFIQPGRKNYLQNGS